ncbi:MAG: hypothetical protein LC775_02050 [Acidobacteria bacterium]|nr:hypothetical protein [Acidobacteriota bacterium]
MKPISSLFLVASCLLMLSCSRHEQTQAVPQAAPSTVSRAPAHDNVAGGFAAPEPGEKETAEFKGTAGTTQKKRDGIQPALLKAVRTGKHEFYDRVVFEFEGNALPGYVVEYVDKPVRDCGRGEVVPVNGDGLLMIGLQPANAHTEGGQPTVHNRQMDPNFAVLRQLKLICDFEAEVQWVLAVSSPNRYRVLELTNPARLVVDITHNKSGQ